MKKILYTTLIISFIFALCLLFVYAKNKTNDDNFNKLTFDVELNKVDYIQYEPMFLELALINNTEESLSILSFPSFNRISLVVDHKGNKTIYKNLFLLSAGRDGFGSIMEFGQRRTGSISLEKDLDKMFPQYGKYKIQVILRNSLGSEIKSEIKEITINEPVGIDKEAVTFLKRKQNGVLFWWDEKLENDSINKTGKTLMQYFVEKYSSSVFGDYAIFRLGNDYRNEGELDKANIEYSKIINSNNKVLSNNAKKAMDEINNKKLSIEKTKQPN